MNSREHLIGHARSARLPIVLALAAAALVAGCIFTTGQLLVHFDLIDPLVVMSPIGVVGVPVDLNSIRDYDKHRQDLHDLADVALLGEITNTGTGSVGVEFWMTTTVTMYVTAAEVRGDATAVQLWGPLSLAPGETRRMSWDDSAGLFHGRAALVQQVKGDGQFTLYALGPSTLTTYSFRIDRGVLVLVIDAGL